MAKQIKVIFIYLLTWMLGAILLFALGFCVDYVFGVWVGNWRKLIKLALEGSLGMMFVNAMLRKILKPKMLK